LPFLGKLRAIAEAIQPKENPMNVRTSIVAMVLAACSSVALAASDTPESVDQAWKKAIVAGDVNGLVACYATDAIGWFPDTAPAKGRDAIRQVFAGMLKDSTISVELTNSHYQTCGTDMAVGWGEFTITFTPKAGGTPTSGTGRFTELLKKEGGKWVYAVDHASPDPAAESAGKP
jgi:uncharacterized protein (TIGR02246 family)